MKQVLIGLIFGFGLIAPVQAHVGGFTYETTVNDYFIDVGANKLNLAQDELTLFEYNLYPINDPNNLAEFDSVYVTISNEEVGVVYAGLIHKLPESISVMSYAFPDSGNYIMSARFDKAGVALAEAEFSVPVGAGQAQVENLIKVVAFVLIIAGAVFWFFKHTKHFPDQLDPTEQK